MDNKLTKSPENNIPAMTRRGFLKTLFIGSAAIGITAAMPNTAEADWQSDMRKAMGLEGNNDKPTRQPKQNSKPRRIRTSRPIRAKDIASKQLKETLEKYITKEEAEKLTGKVMKQLKERSLTAKDIPMIRKLIKKEIEENSGGCNDSLQWAAIITAILGCLGYTKWAKGKTDEEQDVTITTLEKALENQEHTNEQQEQTIRELRQRIEDLENK